MLDVYRIAALLVSRQATMIFVCRSKLENRGSVRRHALRRPNPLTWKCSYPAPNQGCRLLAQIELRYGYASPGKLLRAATQAGTIDILESMPYDDRPSQNAPSFPCWIAVLTLVIRRRTQQMVRENGFAFSGAPLSDSSFKQPDCFFELDNRVFTTATATRRS